MATKMVSYRREDIPPISEARLGQMAELYARPDSEIDLSDIPEWTTDDFKNAVRGRFYRPVKAQVTAKVDSDVVAWLKLGGKGYQTRMNAILRRAMLEELGAKRAA